MIDYKTMGLKTLQKSLGKHQMQLSNATTHGKKLKHQNQIGIIKRVIADKEKGSTMTENLNEAQYTLSVDGLESADADTLSQILSLAGQAETPADLGIGSPMDADLGLGSMNDLGPADDAIGGDLMTGTDADTMGDFRDALDTEPELGVEPEIEEPEIVEPIPGGSEDEAVAMDPSDDDYEINYGEAGVDDEDLAEDGLESAEEMLDFETDPDFDDDEDLKDIERLSRNKREGDLYEEMTDKQKKYFGKKDDKDTADSDEEDKVEEDKVEESFDSQDNMREAIDMLDEDELEESEELEEEADFANRPKPHKYELAGMDNQSAGSTEDKKVGGEGDNRMPMEEEINESFTKLAEEFEAFKDGK